METSVQIFFKHYAVALLSLSARDIADFYQTPLAVYADSGVQTVTKPKEVVAFWEEGVKPYIAMHVEKAIPEVLTEEQVSEKIYTAKVRWINYDAGGNKIAEETNVYMLAKHNDSLKIVGLIITGK